MAQPSDFTRRIFETFSVEVAPTKEALTVKEVQSIHRHIREVMTATFAVKAHEIGALRLRYVAMSEIAAVFNGTTNSSLVTIGEGVVSFVDQDDKTPSTAQVNVWAREAVLDDLLDKLTNDEDLDFITSVGESIDDTSSETTTIEEPEPNIGGPLTPYNSPESDRSTIYVVSGACVGALIVFIVATGFIWRTRNKVCIEPYDNDDDNNENKAGEFHHEENSSNLESQPSDRLSDMSPGSDEHKDISPVLTATLALQSTMNDGDGRSVAASESSWTVKTEAGDSTALKSIPHDTSVNLWQGLPMVSPESFEYDRPVNLRKDMLTSAWSGDLPVNQGNRKESVLEPSHFSASQERRRRRMEDHDVEVPSPGSASASLQLEYAKSFPERGSGGRLAMDDSLEQSHTFGFVPADAADHISMVPPRPKARGLRHSNSNQSMDQMV